MREGEGQIQDMLNLPTIQSIISLVSQWSNKQAFVTSPSDMADSLAGLLAGLCLVGWHDRPDT